MFAQFDDNFADGDFYNAPTWSGMNSQFAIESEALWLHADPQGGKAFLSLPSEAIVEATWEFVVGLEFNPSSANFAQIYLASDQADLTIPLNGYYVLVGNTADDVSLYRQSGSTHTKIIDGRDGLLNRNTSKIVISVSHSSDGTWQLLTGDGGVLTAEGTASDTVHTFSRFFGIACTFTATRWDKFYFDDFVVTGNRYPDEYPPFLDTIKIASETKLHLIFSEHLDETSAETVVNYSMDHDYGQPAEATLQEDELGVILSFDKSFSEGESYSLSLAGIRDKHGNLITPVAKGFVFTQAVLPSPKDIIFTEIMADPSPPVALPETEFIEILNRSEKEFDLAGWRIKDEHSTMIFPGARLLAGEYLILSSSAMIFDGYGKSLGAPGFPTLTNSGDRLVLQDASGTTIDSLLFTDRWYKDTEKMNGGWSLELIDPENLCSGSGNWVASEDPSGGTPGRQNSVFANKPDLTGPALISVFPLSSRKLKLTFNERLEQTLPDVNRFILEPFVPVEGVFFEDESLTSLLLNLGDDLQPNELYTMIADAMYDCSGNAIRPDANRADFGLPAPAEAGDIVINEILFNPRPTGVDFVEIVNSSAKFINLKNFYVSNIGDGVSKNPRTLTNVDFLFAPGGYLVLTENVDILKSEYPLMREEHALVVNDLPAFNDDMGSVACLDDDLRVLDFFFYNKDFHSPFIRDAEGVSLERIAVDGPSNDPNNWKSASSVIGFATPGYLNSNTASAAAPSIATITAEPEVFDPLRGSPSFTQIHFTFDHGGFIANVIIYDERGHRIKLLANNELVGTDGMFRWDGDRDDGSKARIGSYMIWFEIFDSTGRVLTYRTPVVIAAQF